MPDSEDLAAITAEQIAYYSAHALEYDADLERRGRYDDSRPRDNPMGWDLDAAEDALDDLVRGGDVLELACGTGWWTRRLAARANSVTAVDASADMLAINRRRVKSRNVAYVQTNLFDWSPPRRFDLVVFAFWVSHIPRERFDAFWAMVDQGLKPDGTVFVVDQQKHSSMAADEEMVADDLARRFVRDGRSFQIVKMYWETAQLKQAIEGLGWKARFTCPHGDVFHAVVQRALPEPAG